jgi:hypothetical protein
MPLGKILYSGSSISQNNTKNKQYINLIFTCFEVTVFKKSDSIGVEVLVLSFNELTKFWIIRKCGHKLFYITIYSFAEMAAKN